ncbi:alcohol dehydrogenase [Paucibacter sp. R3-3]|uniref:Alcohol dehydrogenase n=1 Tax=Roseateles agri TaxID=3098619 RepID=A0ABU5DFY2_9BURK|nr:alcohol dehydrogenase [Paucibacter sp. R3-3]MDY0744663.1 alcohol dehydrogenase [Paucibacter sp. R3-3]
MKPTYRAMQVSRPGVLELVERPTPTPAASQVLIAVEACGICGADVGDIERAVPAEALPRVPGHEVVGRILALGTAVPPIWRVGQRVGVGRLGGHCQVCPACRQGRFQLCSAQPYVGSSCDGGYAELMLARATGLVAIPDALDSEDAAPLLCAGIATFNALRKCGAQAGDTVAILGIGGLGHMALQYARRMGFRVIAIGRGEDVRADALALGAHHFVDTRSEDAVAWLRALGGAQAIISTVGHADAVSALLGALAPSGSIVLLGAGKDPLPVATGPLIVGEHRVLGSLTGTPFETEKALDFSVLAGVRPMIERMPLERAAEAYQRMKSGDVRFRMVLTTSRY